MREKKDVLVFYRRSFSVVVSAIPLGHSKRVRNRVRVRVRVRV
jgi:hypothetical protein